nr:hypothetical protein [Salinibacterium sp.]
MGTTSTIKTSAHAERERVVSEAVHSAQMEGLAVTAGTRSDADEFVHGAIDIDELIARVDTRHRGV